MNRDDILKHISRRQADILGSLATKGHMLEFVSNAIAVLKRGCEWFDFGELDLMDAVIPAGEDASKFIKAGLYTHPYRDYVFCAKLRVGDNWSWSVSVFFYMHVNDVELQIVQQFMVGKDGQLKIVVPVSFGTPDDPTQLSAIDCGYGSREQQISGAQNVRVITSALWMILNTKGVEIERRQADPKLQASRAKHGKPPLLDVTYVGAAKYADAQRATLEAESGVTHASPRPHLRRAHLVTRLGRTAMRRGCIVNAALGPVTQRDHYKVKGANA